MAEPTPDDIKRYPGDDGTPQNDTDPIGGAIDTGAEINGDTPNVLIYNPKRGSSSNVYRSVAYLKNEAGGDLENAKIFNRGAGRKPTGSGAVKVRSNSALDVDKEVSLLFKSSGTWVQQDVEVNGTVQVVSASSIDAGSDFCFDAKDGFFYGDIEFMVGSEIIGYLYGTYNGDETETEQCNTLYELAVATANDTTVSAANRTANPTGLSSFALAQYWPGLDNAIAVENDILAGGEYVGYCERLTVPANILAPFLGEFISYVDITGDPVP